MQEILSKLKAEYAEHPELDEMIRDLSNGEYVDFWASKLCSEDFGNNKEMARALFKTIEANCETFDDFHSLAERVVEPYGLNDKDWARSLYQSAEELAEDFRDYVNLACSVARKDGLDDQLWARDLFKKAEEIADTFDEFEDLGYYIADSDCLADSDWATRLYKRAESLAEDACQFGSLADKVCRDDGLADREWAKALFEKAVSKADSSDDLVTIANDIVYSLSDKEWAKHVYRKALECCGDDDARKYVIETIKDVLEDDEWASELSSVFGIRFSDDDSDEESISFYAGRCGEIGCGELFGDRLEEFKKLFISRAIKDSDFIYMPSDMASDYYTGVFVSDEFLEDWGLQNAEIKESGRLGIPNDGQGYKPGIYLMYTILADYSVDLETDGCDEIEFLGPKIDLANWEPELSGEYDELVVAHTVVLDGDEKELYEFMGDEDDMRTSVAIVWVNDDGDVEYLYTYSNGDEQYDPDVFSAAFPES